MNTVKPGENNFGTKKFIIKTLLFSRCC